jgi:hypothetical protein
MDEGTILYLERDVGLGSQTTAGQKFDGSKTGRLG